MNKDVMCIHTNTHTHTMEYHSATIKNEITPFAATWMDLEMIKYVRQRKTNIIWYHFYVESKKMIQMNLFTKQKQTHRLQKQTWLPKGKGLGEG